MRRAGRFAWRLVRLVVVILLLTLVAVLVMGAIATHRGLPQTTGTVHIEALHRAVSVGRDRSGVIQITADDQHDLFLAQGYVHAQERMWQMEVSRRIGAGRLAELFGRGQVDTDRYVRTLGWRVAAQRDLDALSSESRAILQAYADGVNAWITEHEGRLSTPFVVAGLLSGTGGVGGFSLEPWTPLDTATWQKVQAWSLGGNADSEIFRFLADARLGDPGLTDELFPAYDANAPVVTPSGLPGSGGAAGGPPSGPQPSTPEPSRDPVGPDASPAAVGAATGGTPGGGTAVPALATPAADQAAALAALAALGSEVTTLAGLDRGAGTLGAHGVGSNNWVVSGEHTRSGSPILANDPHLGLGMPSVWIMNGLHCRTVGPACPWDVVGVSFPGAPAVVLGHNGRIAWGATNVNPDTQDLFLIKPDPSDPEGHYIHGGRSVAYEVRHETIKVAGGPPVELDVRSTRHGVVLSDVDERLEGGPILALRWTTTAEVDLAVETFFAVNRASSFDEFRAAFAGYGSPSQNFVYADVDGHIGYVLPGLIPVRGGACPPGAGCDRGFLTGERVRDGSTAAEEWTGYVPREDLPWQLDPEGGRIVSANNAPVDAGYPHWLGGEWDPGYRASRIRQLLVDAPAKVALEDVAAMQADTRVGRADVVMRRLEAMGPAFTTDDGRVLWERMVEWDRECGVESLGCAAYMSVELALQRALFDDELGPLARDYVGSAFAWEALIDLLGRPASPWWDARREDGSVDDQDAATVAGGAIDAAAAQMRAAIGDPDGWTWGRMHTVTFREATLGSSGIPPLEWYFNPAPIAVPGADGTLNNNYYRVARAYPDPDDPGSVPVGLDRVFEVTNGPSYRFTIDMGDVDGARIMITTGQSGNPFDPHYGDLIDEWAAGETVPLRFSPDNVAGGTVETLTLSP